MADKLFPDDFIGQSPSLILTSADGELYMLVAESNGDSPETWTAKAMQVKDFTAPDVVAVSANKTLALGDGGSYQRVSITSSPLADVTITIPTNASVAFPIGTVINFALVDNGGASPANKLTITGDTGVTVNGTSAGSVDVTGNYSAASAIKVGTNEWDIGGNIS